MGGHSVFKRYAPVGEKKVDINESVDNAKKILILKPLLPKQQLLGTMCLTKIMFVIMTAMLFFLNLLVLDVLHVLGELPIVLLILTEVTYRYNKYVCFCLSGGTRK